MAAIGASPAAADPVAIVTPTNVVDGQTVELQLSGIPGDLGSTVQCSAEVVTSSQPFFDLCEIREIVTSPPARSNVVVRSILHTFTGDNTIDCHVAPGCVVGYSNVSATVEAYAPIVFSPDLAPTPPPRNLTDGDTVHVTPGGTPPAGATVAQCNKAILDDPTPAQADVLCGASTPLSAQTGADVVVHDPFVSTGGDDHTCGHDGCVIMMGPVDGSRPAPSVALSFGPTTVSVDPADHVRDRQSVTVDVAGAPLAGITRAFCLLPLGPDLASSECEDIATTSQQDRWGNVRTTVGATSSLRALLDCVTVGCGVAVADTSGSWLAPAVPVTFTWIDVTSGRGPYLHGDPITVEGGQLTPGNEYRVQHCRSNGECDDGITVTVAADETVATSIPAVQRFTSSSGNNYVCRGEAVCWVWITDPGTGQIVSRPFDMAAGAIAASPDTGLSDGQAVQVTGTDLMPSYEGPVVMFPTGGWALTECGNEVLDDMTLLGVFTHCSVLPPTRPVDISGSTLDTTLDVDATITKILGGTTDCTTEPGRCVVGLVRWEQDATVTGYLTPITFGT